ncbi:NAD(P)H-dependent oxidoreductase [Phenylobacterium soli]|uniref:Flavodoxin family protein n=1 Tax=Phenylobacterium soli TaxID=2170551 RepID=A0A328AHM3_9CAUL|nr:NAD(P)H-dependent oxidoreductase [Phenylobacterium soli]RAK54017.1 flavodoxin family protein [Phenylobacterium soli]
MKHAIVVAHPNPDSLTCAIAQAYAEEARAMGHDSVVRDLYRMGFDPCLKAEEIPGPAGARFGDDVAAERKQIADCDVFGFVYPLWFNAPPAILKGYVDRVFSLGFGYEPALHGTDPLLSGRHLISFTTSGAPEAWVRDTGALNALTAVFDSHVAAVCGMTLVEHIHNGGIVPGITAEAAGEILKGVRAAVRRCFGAGSGLL